MPELPEVEVAKRQLQAKLKSFRVASVINCVREDGTPYKLRKEVPSLEPLVGQTLQKMERYGKYIVFSFEKYHLICHFGMTGMLYVSDKKTIKDVDTKHEIVRLTSTQGQHLSYTDTRKFGLIDVVSDKVFAIYMRNLNLGYEPLPDDFLKKNIRVMLRKYKNRPIKDWMLDQSLIAGIGNIYASELCFKLKWHPLQASSSDAVVSKSKRFKIATQLMLRRAVQLGGSTIRSYETPDGVKGNAQSLHKVYGKEGQPCPRCSTTIETLVIKGRATFFCPECQQIA